MRWDKDERTLVKCRESLKRIKGTQGSQDSSVYSGSVRNFRNK